MEQALPRRGMAAPPAGVLAGLVAGTAYLAAQVTFTGAAQAGGAAEPLQRIAAILLGPDVAPPPADLDPTILGMALLIHYGLAMVFGRIVGGLVGERSLTAAALVGGATGLGLYLLNFALIAPSAFPWFADAITVVTVADHLLFGVVAGVVFAALRGRGRAAAAVQRA
jgi:hypothetical protein